MIKLTEEMINEGWEIVEDTFESVDTFEFNHIDYSAYSGDTLSKSEALDIISTNKLKKSDNPILGVLEGCFFMPDGYSRNRRFYSESLWRKCLESSETKGRLINGMVGMFEHPSVWDKETEEGVATTAHPMYSGIVTKSLKIAESNGKKVGLGKAYILNTPVGNMINVMLKAKDESGHPLIRLAVSSRALAKSKGKDKQGNEIIDENFYHLYTFDVVLNPGIPEAFPEYKAIESAIDNIAHPEQKIVTSIKDFNINESARIEELLRLELGMK